YPDQLLPNVPPLLYTALHPTVPVPLLQRANDHPNQCSPSQWHKTSPSDHQGEAIDDMTELVPTYHFCASSPLREARADNRRSGIGTPMSARFSMMLSASLPMYHQVVTVRRIGSPTTPVWSIMLATATTTNIPTLRAIPRAPTRLSSSRRCHAARTPDT